MSAHLRNGSAQASIPCTTLSLGPCSSLSGRVWSRGRGTALSQVPLLPESVIFLWKYFFPTTMNKRNEGSKTTHTTCQFFGADHMALKVHASHRGLGRGDPQQLSFLHALGVLDKSGVLSCLRVLLDTLGFTSRPGLTDWEPSGK